MWLEACGTSGFFCPTKEDEDDEEEDEDDEEEQEKKADKPSTKGKWWPREASVVKKEAEMQGLIDKEEKGLKEQRDILVRDVQVVCARLLVGRWRFFVSCVWNTFTKLMFKGGAEGEHCVQTVFSEGGGACESRDHHVRESFEWFCVRVGRV